MILLCLIVYYYISICIKIRKLERYPGNADIPQMEMAKYEKRIAATAGLLTAALLISYAPLIIMILFRDFFPVLSGSSFFLWAMTLTELNSLANPVLYCCRNRQMKHAMLELLGREVIEISRNAIHPANAIQLQNLRLDHVHELDQVVQQDDNNNNNNINNNNINNNNINNNNNNNNNNN